MYVILNTMSKKDGKKLWKKSFKLKIFLLNTTQFLSFNGTSVTFSFPESKAILPKSFSSDLESE